MNFSVTYFFHVMDFFRLFPISFPCPIYFNVIGRQVKKYTSLLSGDKNILSSYVNEHCLLVRSLLCYLCLYYIEHTMKNSRSVMNT